MYKLALPCHPHKHKKVYKSHVFIGGGWRDSTKDASTPRVVPGAQPKAGPYVIRSDRAASEVLSQRRPLPRAPWSFHFDTGLWHMVSLRLAYC